MKRCFVVKSFRGSSLLLIQHANNIIQEYRSKGYSLTLRQLYYQFVARDWLANTERNYKKLGSVINDARLAGLIDWSSIEDRTRYPRKITTWNNPAEIVHAAVRSYRTNYWKTQKKYIEVWVEKDALIDILKQASFPYMVSVFSCRGYVSQSAMYRAAERLSYYGNNFEKDCYILYLGDHDPSGIDMTRDILERLDHIFGIPVNIKRLALNISQIEEYNPPPNPAKVTDSRYYSYMSKYGEESWELDSLNPDVLITLIRDQIKSYINWNAWKKEEKKEQMEKSLLTQAAINIQDELDNIDYQEEE